MARVKKEYDADGVKLTMRKRDYLADMSGQLALGLMANLVGQLQYFYTDKVGMAIGSVGVVMAISKILDAFTDVIFGNIIDHSRGGNKKYFRWMISLAVPAAAIVALLFMIPAHASNGVQVNPLICARYGEKVSAHEVLEPVAWLEAPSGELICDFGQNIAGVVSFRLSGKAGQEIVFRHAEALEHGELYVQNLRSAKQELHYICREGEQEYSPRFTYMGFRYVGIRGVQKKDLARKAIAVYSDLETIGSFRCSNEDLNKLQSNLVWSGKDNFVDIPTHCPQRDERQGWTGDIALFASTACFNFDMSRFLGKWLLDLSSEQGPTGAIPFVIPSRKGITPSMTTSCWGDSCMGHSLKDKRIGALVKGQKYAVRMDTFNENGITKGRVMQL